MKTFSYCLMATCLSLIFYPLQSNASHDIEATTVTLSTQASKPSESAEDDPALERSNETNKKDEADKSSPEKKGLKNNVHSIKNILAHAGNGGIYISVGALIIIILLLIIIL